MTDWFQWLLNKSNDKMIDVRFNEFNICLVGRKHPWKGLQILIDMYNSLDKEFRNMINNIFIIRAFPKTPGNSKTRLKPRIEKTRETL
jgi:glycosyltransferase involved in cell wall biosynthesis